MTNQTINDNHNYDVIVVGAGHAGCEAALSASRLGGKTLLLTISLDMIAHMACNPSLGGPGKGHLVKEIDALGGEMAKVADENLLQIRMLNTGKGPAVQAYRAQIDKNGYQRTMRKVLEKENNLYIREDMVEVLQVRNDKITGITGRSGSFYSAKAVIICCGVYLDSKIFLGSSCYQASPGNLTPSVALSQNIRKLGIDMDRFKTGTPPRIHRRSMNTEKLTAVPGDPLACGFSSSNKTPLAKQIPCWMTYTNVNTHEIIKNNIELAPVYSGLIKGQGPRYCPSIEDKIVRFADRNRHPIFIEPEGFDSEELYLQGISSGLPADIQEKFLHTIAGLENAEIMRPAYAIEYDFSPPSQLSYSLETKKIKGLYFAGQVNGTTGYEEAAAQGLIAGINAILAIKKQKPLILKRSESYIGVMIDDLVTRGVNEPYRIFTSRAEYRLLLRFDNADLRLAEIGYSIGLLKEENYRSYLEKKNYIDQELQRLKKEKLKPESSINKFLDEQCSSPLQTPISAHDLIRRPEISYTAYSKWAKNELLSEQSAGAILELENQIKYEGYINKQKRDIEKTARMHDKEIPADFDYSKAINLSHEARQKLDKLKPGTVGQASRMEGVSPADIQVLLLYLSRPDILKKD